MAEFLEFPIEYQTEVDGVSEALRAEAENRLLALTTNHTDMTGASVMVDMAAASETPNTYRVRIVVYMRPNDISASKFDDSAEGAMKEALEAVERQVREQRKKLKETWKRPDLHDQV